MAADAAVSAPNPPAAPPPDTVDVHLVGVGPGPADLLTVRATRLLARCGTCLYPNGTIPAEVLALCPPMARVVGAADLAPTDVMTEVVSAIERGDRVAILLPGDPSQHPALGDLTGALDSRGLTWEPVPGIPAAPAVTEPVAVAEPVHPTESIHPTEPIHPAEPIHSAEPVYPGEPGRILVLGGTGEARRLADLLVTAGLDVVTSLAGKVSRPRLPRGEVRIGGFGGPEGLAHWLRESDIGAVIDATDPFAAEISHTALRATLETGTPLLRIDRPRWEPRNGDEWIRVPDLAAAARVVRERYRRPMLTVGTQGPAAFAGDTRGSYLIRCVEPPSGPLPHRYLLMLDRGPFAVESERTLMSRHRIDVLVTRNSGGEPSAAKLRAAAELRIPVVMVDRPTPPPGAGHGDRSPDTVHSVDAAARWLVEQFGSR